MALPNDLPLDGLTFEDRADFCFELEGERLTWEAFDERFPDSSVCDHCGRVYPEEVEYTGAPVEKCVHCCYEDLHRMKGLEPEFSEALAEDDNPGLARYIHTYALPHDTVACQRKPDCFLCDARLAPVPLKSLKQIRAWLVEQGFSSSPQRTAAQLDRRVLALRFKAWTSLSPAERLAALEALRTTLRLPLEVGPSRAGRPALVHRETGLEFVVVPGKGTVAPFLLSTTPLAGRHMEALGGVTSVAERDLPWTGFNLEHLSPLWRWGLRLPTEAEWRVACESPAGPIEHFVCGGVSPAPVLRADAPVNALGLFDLAGQVAELIGVQPSSVATIGGSALTPRDLLEPMSRPAPHQEAQRSSRCVVEHHPIRPLGGLLPSLVPSVVGLRPAISI